MSDRRGGIPDWQRADYKPPAEDSTSSSSDTAQDEKQAAAISANEPNDSPDAADEDKPTKPAMDAAHVEKQPEVAASAPPQPPPRPEALQPRQLSSTPQQQPPQPAIRPPIITYPEHLVQPQKPPPLVTTARLLNTAYAFAGLAATLYGISNYLVKPMTESLNAARHDFHDHSQSKIQELNERLEKIVSVDPVHGVLKGLQEQSKEADGAIDTASVDSDPTELFHRDMGTQTAPEDLPKSDSSSDLDAPKTTAEAQQQQLNRLRGVAADLSSDGLQSESQTVHEFRTIAEMLREQLEGLAFPASSDGGSYGYSGAGFNNLYGTNVSAKKETDEIGKMKQEIRSLKGSLLSARSFPAGGPVPPGRRDLFPPK